MGQGAESTSRATLQVNRQTATHQREERNAAVDGLIIRKQEHIACMVIPIQIIL